MVKTPDELALMRVSGRLLAAVFEMLDRQPLATVDRRHGIGQAVEDRHVHCIEERCQLDHLVHVGHAQIRMT